MNSGSEPMLYTPAQRAVALAYGLVCHTLFALAVGAMVVGLYSGLTIGAGRLHGAAALAGNAALLLQFALTHTLLLTAAGRRFMSRLAPPGLGAELSTTIFASIASLQLFLTVLLWSPSRLLWFDPSGGIQWIFASLYAGSWILLLKSMYDSGLPLQTGFLGWGAVWRNRKPVYGSFPREGTYRHVRQPIYLSFALILWTAPVWTPDRLFMTLLWTAYLLIGPRFKERRYRKWYGDSFVQYAKTVPYWIPKLKGAARALSAPPEES